MIGKVIGKIFRIEKFEEKPTYVKDNITKDVLPVKDNEFKGEKIIHYRLIFANYFEIGLRIIPIEAKLDKVIPFWIWIEKQAIPLEYVNDKLKN